MLFKFLRDYVFSKQPESLGCRALLAQAKMRLGQGDKVGAEEILDQLLLSSPRDAEALQLRATLFSIEGNLPLALDCFRRAVKAEGKNPAIKTDYGSALLLNGELEEAESQFRQVLNLSPGNPLACRGLGRVLIDLGRVQEALTPLRAAHEQLPNDLVLLAWLGGVEFGCMNYENAYTALARVRLEGSLNSDGYHLLGTAAQLTGRLSESNSIYLEALGKTPESANLKQQQAFTFLIGGEWEAGFALYEERFHTMRREAHYLAMKNSLEFIDSAMADVPLWQAEPLAGKSILLWVEQGFGDVIMVMRMLPVLRRIHGAKKVSLLGPESVRGLCNALDGVSFIPNQESLWIDPREFDYHCSLMSLLHRLKVTPENIPGTCPYFVVPEEKDDFWARRLSRYEVCRVGLVWAGGAKLSQDALRSMAFADFGVLEPISKVSLFSLQKDHLADEDYSGLGLNHPEWIDECADFMDTAAFINALDLVISVDTAVAHLAGALGKPVWLLNRYESEWRWLRGRKSSVWYPSMRIFNQTESKNWGPVLEELAGALTAYARDFKRRPGLCLVG